MECLESGSVLYESKDGPYHPLEDDEIMVRIEKEWVKNDKKREAQASQSGGDGSRTRTSRWTSDCKSDTYTISPRRTNVQKKEEIPKLFALAGRICVLL